MVFEPIGITGLVIQIYVSCIHGYRAYLKAKERHSDSSVLIIKLRIEAVRLESWGAFWGLTEGIVHDDLGQDTATLSVVLKTLEEIKRIMEDTASLSSKYGLMEQLLDLQVDDLVSSTHPPTKRKRVTALSAVASTAKHTCSWVIADKEKFESLVRDLKDFNDGLYNMTLPAKERRSLTNAVVCTFTSAPNRAPSLADIRTASGQLESITGTSNEPYKSLEAIASFRLQSMELVERSLRIDKGSVTLPSPTMQMAAQCSLPSIGVHAGAPVLIEWRAISHNADSRPHIAHLASLLAFSPKPANFRVLDLTGYYEDTSNYRLCFISRLPALVGNTSLPPINLYGLIARSGKLSIPALGDRFRLAQMLATSLLQLHAAGWLHRRVRSDIVLFFRSGDDAVLNLDQVDLTQPYVTGFGYAYPDGFWMQPKVASHSARSKEHDLYRHHASTVGAYRREYDVYSLGMLLLEIGLWTRLGNIRQSMAGDGDFLAEVKSKYVPSLSYKCGSIYEGVVRRCLDAVEMKATEAAEQMFWEWEERKGKEHAWFYWEIVKELEKCCA